MLVNGNNIYIRITFLLLFNIALGQVEKDSLSISKNDTITTIEVLKVTSDTLVVNDTIPKKERIQDIIDYNSDEQYSDIKNKFTYLVKNADVTYLDMNIKADYIQINWDTGDIYAEGERDSIGNVVTPSIFTQNGKEIEYKQFKYNIKTKQGTVYNVRTEESMGSDKGVIVAGVVRQYNDSISGMRKVAYTTDDLFIEKKDSIADYYLQTEVAKYIQGKNKKTIITGPIVMKIYDITTPLALPFAFLPSGEDRHAGILLPSFGERESQGFFLQGLGFYIPFGEYMDLTLTGDIYTRGSLGFHANSQYKKRYKFNGGFRFDWERRLNGIKGLADYSKSTLYRIQWNHSQDAKANPNLIFAASVNFSSSQYYRNGINNQNLINGDVLTNTTSSSISINKTFPNSPFTASLTMSHNQNNSSSNTSENPVTFNLPTLAVNMSNIYPFAPKSGSKKGLVQSLGVRYNFNLQNTIYTNDNDVFTDKMFDNVKNGAKHKISLNTGTTLFNYFPVNFSAGYNEVWYMKSIEKRYNETTDEVDDIEQNGFATYRTFNTSASIQTTLYNTRYFEKEGDEKDRLIKAFRHMVTPSIGFGYTPDFSAESWGYYNVYRDGRGEKHLYSRFEDGIYGSPGSGLSTSINYSLANSLEMKVRSRKDSIGIKKIKIFESLNISGSYNMAADSLKFSTINISGSSSFLDGKIRVNFGANIDPYELYFENEEDERGTVIDEFGAFRLTNYNIGTGYSFSNKTFGEKKDKEYKRRGNARYENFSYDDDGYAKFSIPWSVNTTLTYRHSKGNSRKATNTASLALNGRISPTPHWEISGSTNIDLVEGEFSYTRFSFSRNLRSFVIDFSWVPFGQYKTWDFFIGIRASFLRDAVKYDEKNFNSIGQEF